jgi:hypothetical protein
LEILTSCFPVRHLRVRRCGALFLTRGRVCRSQLLFAFDSAVIFGSESLGTRDHILLSQIRDFPFRRLLRLAGLRIRTLLHTGSTILNRIFFITTFHGPNRKHPFPTIPILLCLPIRCLEAGSSIVACVFVAAGMFMEPLPSNRCLFWLHCSGFLAAFHIIFETSHYVQPNVHSHQWEAVHRMGNTEFMTLSRIRRSHCIRYQHSPILSDYTRGLDW